ncbi:unnamed protein product [Fructobacillus cardui]|uniref:hypothetical protein n=1 Tax=Fructobacillus cardui TaxID=2893170 RepID=UPI001436D27D|nr:hypothetical protein [Fructobacillus cardui]MCK8627176.1 hypothetical protein [Fructobacillus cardui]QHJ83577.1 MAG: hypothetical protein [Caudoviricetes sp.]CAK1230383.1 unnamed protein product [Fructobacillus cardui]
MKKKSFAKMIRKYAIDFQYAKREDKTNALGETVKGFGDKVSVHEVILPYNQGDMPVGANQTVRQSITDAGVVQTTDHVWYSLTSVPVGTRVYHNWNEYEVIAVDDYSDYSDVVIYYLKGQTNL